jgi:hypothetical protein
MLNTDYKMHERFALVVVSSGDFTNTVTKIGIHIKLKIKETVLENIT